MPVSTVTSFTGPDLELDEYYPAKIVRVDEVENTMGTDPRVNIVLQIIDAETRKPLRDEDTDKPIEVFNYVNIPAGAGKKSKIYQIWSGMFHGGGAVPDDEMMDTDELVGLYCRFMWGMVVNPRDKTERPGIVKMTALKSAKAPGSAAKNKALEDEIDAV